MRFGKITDVDAKKQQYRQEVGVDGDGKAVKSPWIPYGQHAGLFKSHNPPSVGQQMIMLSPDGDFNQAMGLPMTWSDNNKSPGDKPDEHVTTFETKKDDPGGQNTGGSQAGSQGADQQNDGSDQTTLRYKKVLNKDSVTHIWHDENGKPRSSVSQSNTAITHTFMDENGKAKSRVIQTADAHTHQILDGDDVKSERTQSVSSIKNKVTDVSHEMTADGQKNTAGKITHDGKDISKTHKHTGVQPGTGDTDVPDNDS